MTLRFRNRILQIGVAISAVAEVIDGDARDAVLRHRLSNLMFRFVKVGSVSC